MDSNLIKYIDILQCSRHFINQINISRAAPGCGKACAAAWQHQLSNFPTTRSTTNEKAEKATNMKQNLVEQKNATNEERTVQTATCNLQKKRDKTQKWNLSGTVTVRRDRETFDRRPVLPTGDRSTRSRHRSYKT